MTASSFPAPVSDTMPSSHDFAFMLPVHGEMAERIRAHDWSSSPAGAPSGWPAALKTTLSMMLGARFPMFLAWGDSHAYFYNDAFIDILADRHPSALGRRLADIAPEAWETVSSLIGRALAGQEVYHEDMPFKLRRKGYDEQAWFTVSYSPVLDDAGAAIGVLGVCVETTGRLHAEQARLEEIGRLREVFEQAPVPIAVLMGPEHRYEISNAMNQVFLQHRAVLGLPAAKALPEATEQGLIALLDQVYQSGEPYLGWEVPVTVGTASGTPALHYVNFIYQPIRDSLGRVIGIFSTGSDITSAVLATRALEASEQRFRTMIDAVPQMIWCASPDGANTYFNKQWYAFTGMPAGNLDGWMAVHPDDRACNAVQWRASVATGIPYEVKNRLRHHSGEYRWTLVRALPVRDAAGEVTEWMGTNTDIDEQERAVEALQQASARKDEFLAMLAHELRNPLAPISAAAELLALRAAQDAGVRQAAGIIARQVDHIVHLVDDLLDASRVTRGLIQLERSMLDMREVAAGALEQVRPLLERHRHHLAADLPASAVHVLGDGNRLVQVLANLLNNAAKYTPEGGHVSLAMKAGGETVEVCVADDGAGMTPDQLRQAFELFYQGERTLDRAQGGLGIGLALAKSLAQQHGGSIAASSDGPGKGSRFVLTLPRAAAGAPSGLSGVPLAAAGAQRASSRRVLVVDDNVDAALSLGLLLESMGHVVVTAHDAAAALARHREASFDAYLLDLGLPGVDGFALARLLRADPASASSLFVALTGYGQEQDKLASKAAGFDCHLVKPVGAAQLHEVLASCGAGIDAQGARIDSSSQPAP
ncbi:PAS domain-containing protein [Noviherbaspirillum galbum]|uniref:histidine kinase n=1 Tax=Noviherbaspirillum galbum TaxID=2709383 RepID=A0A6B3ST49_9BURK|nr:PAS domain-containing protein [Noviherbaspirillum galbum]NEX64150.1 PAS domain-containing protein [Noviherbaspirillum galbum]